MELRRVFRAWKGKLAPPRCRAHPRVLLAFLCLAEFLFRSQHFDLMSSGPVFACCVLSSTKDICEYKNNYSPNPMPGTETYRAAIIFKAKAEVFHGWPVPRPVLPSLSLGSSFCWQIWLVKNK
ncbi:hypothetical protein P7K49_037976 [Saguinus oedipus]|uniref:Uncharacterized protein n=1 Tax=Saguinus oedipus TaxID=9490 RepID=A0ABQ9TDN5_SAGOE|nr:hypothetical protein P7K49_037976 [Saguinus oedipus]